VNPLTHTGWMSPNAMAPVSPGTPPPAPAPAPTSKPGPERTPTYSGLTAQEKTGASFANFFSNLFNGASGSAPVPNPATASVATTTGLPGKMALDPSAYSYSTPATASIATTGLPYKPTLDYSYATPAPKTVSITTTGLPYKTTLDYSYATPAPKISTPTYGLDLKPSFSPRVEYNLQAKQATMGTQKGTAAAYGAGAFGSGASMSTLFMGDSMGEGIAEASAFDDYWYDF
jgi:hypothetical protein